MGRAVIVSIAILLLRLLGLGLDDPELVLDEVTADQYSAFLKDLRSQLGATEDPKWKILLLRQQSKVPDAQRFVQATLTSGTNSVTLGIDVINLYLYAYRGSARSYFFDDALPFAKTYLFNGTQKITLPFKSNYQSLGNRENVNLGIDALRNAMNVLAKEPDLKDTQKLKKPFLVIIQMVCEAARFKYIEDKIRQSIHSDGIYDGFMPDNTILDLENDWAKLSTAVQNAYSNGLLKEPVKIGDEELRDVTEVKEYLAVMKNINR